MAIFSKIEIAKIQIEKSIDLYLNEQDYISSITLAGAAEEIVGKLLEKQGRQSSYAGLKVLLKETHRQLSLKEPSDLDFNEIANSARNNLKHLSGVEYIEKDFQQEAYNIIHRAIGNYSALVSGLNEMNLGTEKMNIWVKFAEPGPIYPIVGT